MKTKQDNILISKSTNEERGIICSRFEAAPYSNDADYIIYWFRQNKNCILKADTIKNCLKSDNNNKFEDLVGSWIFFEPYVINPYIIR